MGTPREVKFKRADSSMMETDKSGMSNLPKPSAPFRTISGYSRRPKRYFSHSHIPTNNNYLYNQEVLATINLGHLQEKRKEWTSIKARLHNKVKNPVTEFQLSSVRFNVS